MDDLVTEAFRSAVSDAQTAIDLDQKLADFVVEKPNRFGQFGGDLGGLGFGSITAACAATVMAGVFLLGGLQADSPIDLTPSVEAGGSVELGSDPDNARGEFNSSGGYDGLTSYEDESSGEESDESSDGADGSSLPAETGTDESPGDEPQTESMSEQELDTGGPAGGPETDEAELEDSQAGTFPNEGETNPPTTRSTQSTVLPWLPTSVLPTSTSGFFPTTTTRSSSSSVTSRSTTTPRTTASSSPTSLPTTTEATTTTGSSTTTSSITTTVPEYSTCAFAIPSGASIAEATASIRAGGCTGTLTITPASAPASREVSRVVGGLAQEVDADSSLTLFAKSIIPNLVGMTESEATAALNGAYLTPGRVLSPVPFGDERAGTVLDQTSTPGGTASYLSVVTYQVAVEEALPSPQPPSEIE